MKRKYPLEYTPHPVIHHVSASQITKALGCMRRWWYEKMAGLKEDETEAMRFGKALHAYVEACLLGQAPDATDPVIQKLGDAVLLAMYDDPVYAQYSLTHIETYIDLTMPCGVPVEGWVDVRADNDTAALILDHKTSSDGAKWGKTPAKLLKDAQMTLYAEDAYTHGATSVAVGHNTACKKTGKVFTPRTPITMEQVAENMAALDLVVLEMIEAGKVPVARNVSAVPKNKRNCRAFGKECMHAGYCNRNTVPRRLLQEKTVTSTPRTTWKERQALRQAQEAASVATACLQQAHADVNAATVARLRETDTAYAYPPADQLCPPDAEPNKPPVLARDRTLEEIGITPVLVGTLNEVSVYTAGDLFDGLHAGLDLCKLKGVGAKKADAIKAAVATLDIQPRRATPDPYAADMAQYDKAPTILLINCTSVGSKCEDLSEVLRPLGERVAEMDGNELWYAENDYGAGGKHLAKEINANLDMFKGRILAGSTADPAVNIAYPLLSKIADHVFVGMR